MCLLPNIICTNGCSTVFKHQHLLSTCYVPDSVVHIRGSVLNKMNKIFFSSGEEKQ